MPDGLAGCLGSLATIGVIAVHPFYVPIVANTVRGKVRNAARIPKLMNCLHFMNVRPFAPDGSSDSSSAICSILRETIRLKGKLSSPERVKMG